jgi:predicted TPR repeat methyltransferase
MPDSSPPGGQPTTISYADALQLAMRLHRAGQLDAADKGYRALCDAQPDDPNPIHFRGVLLHQRGKEEALDLIRRSIAMDGNVASWHNNLGNVLLDRGKVDDALAAYTRCSELDPDNVEVLNNLGVLLRNQKRYDEAEATLKRALAKNAAFANAHTNLASLYYELKRIPEGHKHIAAVLALEPTDPTARKMLAMLYASMGRLDEAAAIFREWLAHEPNSQQARHHLAACVRDAMPDRATEGYVEEVFDSFAGSFDAKLAALDYRAPQLVGEAVARLLGVPALVHSIIDAGCGTGLCGPFLAPYARRLVGVDLSGNMLERARARGLYGELVKSDLVAYLEKCEPGDLVVSADTLCYFGRLDSVARAARQALRPDGHFVFTVEAHDAPVDFRLNPNGRYSHADAYVRAVLGGAGFAVISMSTDRLRNEGGKPASGWVVIAQAAAA